MFVLFALSTLLIVHTFFFYGVSLWFLTHRKIPEPLPALPSDSELPLITMVVAAYDEVACIEAKLRNFQSLDYPPDRLELIVGSDGSTDGTDAIVARFASVDGRIHLSSAPRSGKSGVLNRCIPMARGAWVLLTDANTMLKSDALKCLARHLVSPNLGAVSGRLVLTEPGCVSSSQPSPEGEGLYWRYETHLKILEGRMGILLGANGALYAVRRSLFTPLSPETIVDDLVIPLRLAIDGHALRYEPDALAFEETAGSLEDESHRRVRIAAGDFQSLTWLSPLLLPRYGKWTYAFWSHKLLRWSAPLWLLLALLSNAALAMRGRVWMAMLALQLSFYGLALLGALLPQRWRDSRGTLWRLLSPIRVAYYFVRMNVSLAQGFIRFALGKQKAAWERSARPIIPSGAVRTPDAGDGSI